jgi:hypothetical protein
MEELVHDLPIHPRTGLTAVGIVGGRPVWPIKGGSEPAVPAGQPAAPAAPPATGTPPTPTPPPAATGTPPAGAGTTPDPATGDQPLGEGGLKALQAERDARKELEKQLQALAPLQQLATALGADPAKGKTEIEQITERLAAQEKQLSEANQARWRAEVANTKKLTPEQMAELRGSTAEEFAAHADRLLAAFPTAPAAPGTPRPDPSQGGRSGGGPDLEAQIAEAQKKGDWRSVVALQNQKLPNQ